MNKISRKLQLLIGLVLLVVVIGASVTVWLNRPAAEADVSDSQLRTKLGCGRMTADFRETDVFCGNLDIYRKLTQRGVIPGATTTSTTVKLALVTATGVTKLVANASVQLTVSEAVQCVRAPCPPMSHTTWSGTTDDIGVVQVPRDKITSGTQVVSRNMSGSIYSVSPTKAAYIVPLYITQK